MESLAKEECTACRADAPAVTGEERSQLLADLPGWQVEEVVGIPHLTKTFTFDDFVSAVKFTNTVGELAEQAGHHPAILTEWGKVKVSWWTHKIKNLHRNDFIMAARTQEAFDTE